MALIERDVALPGVDENGNPTIDLPITRLGNVENTAEVKATIGEGDYIPIADASAGGRLKKILASVFQLALKGKQGQVVGFGADGKPVAQGTESLVGPPGPKGDTGATGATGPRGPQGPAGPVSPYGCEIYTGSYAGNGADQTLVFPKPINLISIHTIHPRYTGMDYPGGTMPVWSGMETSLLHGFTGDAICKITASADRKTIVINDENYGFLNNLQSTYQYTALAAAT